MQNKSRRQNGLPKLGSSSDVSGAVVMKETLDEVSDFVQHALPVLMEIVRKGGRYAEESVASLRPSFQDAITTGRDTWNKQVSPPNFAQFLALKNENTKVLVVRCDVPSLTVAQPSWTADSASPHCLLCVDKFTYSNRRHHCRGCGILCCDLCSMKRMPFKPAPGASGGNSPTPASSSAKPEGSRTCDGCFNKFQFEFGVWQQAAIKAKREQDKLEAQRALESSSTKSGSSPSGGDRRAADSPSPLREHGSAKAASSVTNSAAAASSTMSETMRALEERGNRLQDTADKSEQMVEVSSMCIFLFIFIMVIAIIY